MKRIHRFPFIHVCVLIVALFGVLWPLIRPGFYISDDGEWMVIRLSAFYQSLADGQFPVRFLGRLNNSYGYPVANFLYPGFLYIGSFLHFLGLSFVTSIKAILVVSVVGSALWTYASLKRLYSAFASIVGSLTFIASPYLLYDLYSRGSVGEVLAFLPASAGIFSILSGNTWLFTLSVAGLIVSHNTLAVLFLTVLVVYIFATGKRGFFLPLCLGLGIAAFFWMSALWEKQYVRFDLVTVSSPREYMLNIRNAWLMGFAGLAAGLVMLVHRRGVMIGRIGWTALLLFGGSVFLTLPVSQFFWSFSSISSLVQFPYRMLSIATLMTPWVVAPVVQRYEKKKPLVVGAIVLLLILPAWHIISRVSYVLRETGYYTTNEGTTTVADEYMPRWVKAIPEKRSAERIIFQKGRGNLVYEYLNTQRTLVHVDVIQAGVLRIQTVYYPGWGVLLDGVPIKATYDNEYGFMDIPVSVGKHSVETEFRETVPRFITDMVSVGSLVVWMILLVRAIKKHPFLSFPGQAYLAPARSKRARGPK
ncbi:hypothetical protein HY949_04240 [Candidatus Gottesmanbacteria bacterium]|nr:hypothetical protein [Candidatus Gottesmanbacteria bacterium]